MNPTDQVNFVSPKKIMPLEVRATALSLDPTNLAIASCVCKDFKAIAEDHSLWIELAKKWNIYLVDPENAKKSFLSGLRAINQGVREVFPEIPESKNLFKQHKANSAYLVDRIEKMKFKVVRDKYKKEIYDAVDREIEVGRTDHLLALLSCGVKLSPKQLKNAAKKKQKEVVRS